ncbi:hypothetical protein KAR91_03745 [Candidatus Pacearchaeota archaeon]|nr:hypothetical protein [Candidatus Pacearchaeota archaeon]
MLRGKILRIKWIGVFEATIDGKSKRFNDWQSMYDWFAQVLKYAKDDKKRAILEEDLRKIRTKSG